MKKFLGVIFITLIAFNAYGQSAKTRTMLAEIEGEWSLDDYGNVTYTRIVEAEEFSKDEIFNRALNYFVYNYGSGKSVIQTQDKELGRVVGKGLYDDVHVGVSLITTYVDCWHIARVDAKEGRARIFLTLTQFDTEMHNGSTPPTYNSSKVEDNFPVNPKGNLKNVMGKAFYKSHQVAIGTLDAIERSIKEGNTSKGLENDDW